MLNQYVDNRITVLEMEWKDGFNTICQDRRNEIHFSENSNTIDLNSTSTSFRVVNLKLMFRRNNPYTTIINDRTEEYIEHTARITANNI